MKASHKKTYTFCLKRRSSIKCVQVLESHPVFSIKKIFPFPILDIVDADVF